MRMDVQETTDLSIWIQIITGILSFQGILLVLPKEHQILTDILKLESFVQVIELLFYIFYLRSLAKTVTGMALVRYYDWFITTPIMLLTTIMYMKYEEFMEKTPDSSVIVSFGDFMEQHRNNIVKIMIANFFMLLLGYLGEKGVVDMHVSTIVGFMFFTYTFSIIYNEYAIKSEAGKKLFNFLVVVWGLYGVAFLANDELKNNSINFLDIIAKNFFGLYLFFKARAVSVSTK